jgi:tetratricopeptide (TPR) repeat protein
MIEYLEKLIADKEWQKALAYAEQLLLSTHNSPADVVAINCAIMTCRYFLKDYNGAVVAGQLALRLAADCREWDYYGVACLDLGASFMITGRHEQAADVFYGYLAKLSKYTAASIHEPKVWFNLGRVYSHMGDNPQSLHALRRALDAAVSLGNQRYANGIRQALADAHIQAEQFRNVPRLLAQCGRYLRENPSLPDSSESQFWYLKLRIDYLLATHRLRRASAIALLGIENYEGEPRYQFFFHMQLARIARRMGSMHDALGHSIAGRIYAAHSGRADLEAEAADLIYELTTGNSQYPLY